MPVTPFDLAQYKHTLPYASEGFGLYQPLLGWRAKRAVQRQVSGLAAAVTPAFTSAARLIQPAVTPSTQHDRHLQIQTGATTVPPEGRYHPAIASTIADLIKRQLGPTRTAVELADPQFWSTLLAKERLDRLLAKDVAPTLAADGHQPVSPSAMVVRVTDGAGDALAQAQRESVIAGALNTLAVQRKTSVLRALFYPPARTDTDRQEDIVAMVDPLAAFDPAHDWNRLGLSPVGIVHLFRQYFFEFDSFLGPPVQHVWLSPGGTVELIEVSTRKVTVDRTTESSTDTTVKSDKSETSQDDLSEAVKTDNQDNLKIGAQVSSNQRWGWGDANETGSINHETSEKTAREKTHKEMRQQSATLSSEIKNNFKSTFRTVTETTDTTSKRYLLTNATQGLVNYELRRKMRYVGVQVQDLGSQLCWQTYIDDPGADLEIAQLVHKAAPPDFSGLGPVNEIKGPDDYTEEQHATAIFGAGGDDPDDATDYAGPLCYIPLRPKDGYEYSSFGDVRWTSGDSFSLDIKHEAANPDVVNHLGNPPKDPYLIAVAVKGSSSYGNTLSFVLPVTFTATQAAKDAVAKTNQLLAAQRDQEKDDKIRDAYMTNAIDRINVAANMQRRSFDDLREEERTVVYRKLIADLCNVGVDLTADSRVMHKAAELINSMFDIDAMLYFVAPDYWRPHAYVTAQDAPPVLSAPPAKPGPKYVTSLGRMTKITRTSAGIDAGVAGWKDSQRALGRGTYYVTKDSAPAQIGASLGWLLQLDGDNQRNAFLNSPWVKAVIPIRAGKELDALNWLSHIGIEGEDGLDDRYQSATPDEDQQIIAGLEAWPWQPGPQRDRYTNFAAKVAAGDQVFVSVRDALMYLCLRIQALQRKSEEIVSADLGDGVTLNYLRPEMVYEHGFDPLQGGFRANTIDGQEYTPFDQWTEVLPTDQVVAVEVQYDPKTGRQL